MAYLKQPQNRHFPPGGFFWLADGVSIRVGPGIEAFPGGTIMKTYKLGAVIGATGGAYLVLMSWAFSWWYVPSLMRLGTRLFSGPDLFGGAAFFILWGTSGVLGAMIVATGAALYAQGARWRWLLLTIGCLLLLGWLALWSAASIPGFVFGVGGGLILLCFLMTCLDWAATRPRLAGPAATAADLRLAAYLSYFIAAWGLCGLLGAPLLLLHPEPNSMQASAGSTMAVKVMVCLVLGSIFTAVAQRLERRAVP